MGDADKPGVVAAREDIDTIDGVAQDASRPPLVVARASVPQPDYPSLVSVEKSHYELGETIGKGGMGHVFKARDRRLGRGVAIKELLPTSRENARRFEREARITARLQHPAIVHVYEAGVWPGGEPFYSMNYVAGERLGDVIKAQPDLDGRLQLIPTVIAVAEAIAYAHNENIIHRDLKPSNVLVGAFGETVVIDWGLAKDLGVPVDPQESLSMRRRHDADETHSERVIGTPAYMPPEQARGDSVDRRADVYSIGALLYHVITGRPPYGDKQPGQDTVELVKAGPCTPIDEIEPETPVELVSIVNQAMARAPIDRYGDAAELAADLKAFQAGALVSSRNYTRRELIAKWLTKHRVVVGVVTAAVVALAVVGAISVSRIVEEKRKEQLRRNTLLEERGRSELLAGQAGRAIVYLAEAARDGHRGGARGVLLADALRPFEAQLATMHAVGLPDTIAFTPDGTALTLDTEIHAWAHGSERWFGMWGSHTQLLVGGDRVVTIDGDRVARVWSKTGELQRELRGHTADILDANLSANGKVLVTGSLDGTARVWALDAGTVRTAECGTQTPVIAVRLAPDGERVVSATDDNVLCYWEATSGKFIKQMRGHRGRIQTIRWAPDRKLVATASADGNVLLWDPYVGKPVIQPITHDGRAIASAEFSADGRLLLTAGADQLARLWELPDEIPKDDPSLRAKEVRRFAGHTSTLTTAVFDPKGERIATGGVDNKAKVWDASTGELLATFEHADVVRGVAFSPDSNQLLTTSTDRTSRLWDLLSGMAKRPIEADSVIHGVAVAPDGTVAAALADSRILVQRTGDATPQVLRDHTARVLAIAYSPDGRWLASGGEDASALVFSATTLTKSRALEGHQKRIRSVAFSADSTQLVTAGDEGVIRIWLVATGQLLRTLEHTAPVAQLALSPDGTIAAVDDQGHVVVWSSASSTPQLQPQLNNGLTRAIAFSADGQRFVASGTDTKIFPSLAGTIGLAQLTIDGPTGELRAVAFTRDGTAVITAGVDGLVQLWDADKGKLLGVRGTRGATIHALATSGDGLLWVGGADQLLRVWDIHAEERDVLLLGAVMRRTPWRLDDLDAVVRRSETGED